MNTNAAIPRGGLTAERRAQEFDRRFGVTALYADLKGKTIRGGAFTVASQITQFVCYTVSSIVLGRLLSPQDYGLVGMVSAVIGFLRVCNYAGLSTATVQRTAISHELVSNVFWLNIALGLAMTALSSVLAPGLALFYQEPRLLWITFALAATFMLDASSSQHLALLRRQMRFRTLAIIEISAMTAGVVSSIIGALTGLGYWSLVLLQTVSGLVSVIGVWIVEPWRPGLPRKGTGVGSMLRFGGYLTGVSLLTYLFRNADNVLIGWRWGAGPLGFYQKAYSLLMLPVNQVNSPIESVAISALSRVSSDAERQKRYFIGGYALATAITVPIVIFSAIFAGDIIPFLLGKQWTPSVRMFQLLAPAALIGTLLSPFYALFVSSGHTDRQFKMNVVWTILILLAFAVGLKYGPEGVAVGFSIMSILLAVPVALYALKGSAIHLRDVFQTLKYPVISMCIPAVLAIVFRNSLPAWVPVSVRAVLGFAGALSIYSFVLLIVFAQWDRYRDLLAHLMPSRK